MLLNAANPTAYCRNFKLIIITAPLTIFDKPKPAKTTGSADCCCKRKNVASGFFYKRFDETVHYIMDVSFALILLYNIVFVLIKTRL